jgi:hypothetical protein
MILKPQKFRYPIKGHPFSKGLVGCWLMNEGSGNKVYDLSGNRNTGSFVADTGWAPGKFGGPCLSLGGIGGYVSLNTPISNYPFTLSAWVKFGAAVNTTLQILSVADKDHYGTLYNIAASTFDASSDFRGVVATRYQGGSWGNISMSSGIFPWNGWHLVTGVFISATLRTLYLDGVYKGNNTTSVLFDSAGIDRVFIGANADSSPDAYWNGLIDIVMIYNRALSTSEIAQLYREPFAMVDRRQIWPSGAGAPPAGHPYYYQQLLNRRTG